MPHGVLTVHFGAASPVMRSNLKIKLAPKTIADQHDHFEAFGFVDPAFVCDDYLPRIALWSHRNRYIGGPIADVLHLDPYTGLELSGRLGCLLHSAWSWFAGLRASRAQARKMFQHIGAVHKISGLRGFRARRAPSTCTPVIGTRRFFPLGEFRGPAVSSRNADLALLQLSVWPAKSRMFTTCSSPEPVGRIEVAMGPQAHETLHACQPSHRTGAGTSTTTVVRGSRATRCADARPSGWSAESDVPTAIADADIGIDLDNRERIFDTRCTNGSCWPLSKAI